LQNHISQFDLVVVAAGNGVFTKNLRKLMNISQSTNDYEQRDEVDRLAINLIYETATHETFERNGKPIDRYVMGAEGITYSHSNDSKNHVQIYTYPVGALHEVFASMPESFKTKAAYSGSGVALTLDGKRNGEVVLSEEEAAWFKTYANAVKRVFQKFDMPVPAENQIKVFFASRYEYHYEKAAGLLYGVPVLFVGDSCGSTDYKLGLSLGRGLLAAFYLAN
jgi:Alr-MurF fusion protein